MQSVASGAAGSWSLSNLGHAEFATSRLVSSSAFSKDLGHRPGEAKRLGLCLPGLAAGQSVVIFRWRSRPHSRRHARRLELALAAMSNVDWTKRKPA